MIFQDLTPSQLQPKEKKKEGKIRSLKSPHELQTIFEELDVRTLSGGDSEFAATIGGLKDEDIVAVAVVVGVASPNRLSRQKAIDGVRKRVQEAMQL